MGHWGPGIECIKFNYHQHQMSLVLPEDYGELCAQQPRTKTSRDDVNKAKAVSQAVPSHAGRSSRNSVTRYRSLEINYHTARNNERTSLPILQKIISVPLCLLGRAEYRVGQWITRLHEIWAGWFNPVTVPMLIFHRKSWNQSVHMFVMRK